MSMEFVYAKGPAWRQGDTVQQWFLSLSHVNSRDQTWVIRLD